MILLSCLARNFPVDGRESSFTVILSAHFIVQWMIKHVLEFLFSHVRICVKHLESAKWKTIDWIKGTKIQYNLFSFSNTRSLRARMLRPSESSRSDENCWLLVFHRYRYLQTFLQLRYAFATCQVLLGVWRDITK